MQNFIIEKDIPVLYVTASSFPDGILPAFQQLHTIVPDAAKRRAFGISRPEDGNKIIYRAGAEEIVEGEAEKLGLGRYIVKKGTYISIDIPDFVKDVPAVGKAFEQLLADTRIDPEGECVEWYMTEKDVKCMVRIIVS